MPTVLSHVTAGLAQEGFMGQAWPIIFGTAIAVLGFGFIIFIHELGHFLAAKLFKVKVRAFSLGFPPTFLHKQMGETDYRLGAIPVGGYVSMLGEDPSDDEVKPDDPRALCNIAPWKRVIVFMAGVAMNVASAMAIYVAASFMGIEVTAPVVGHVAANAPARVAGLESGMRIERIDDQEIGAFDDIMYTVLLGAADDPDHVFEIQVEGRDEPIRTVALTDGSVPLPMLGVDQPVLAELTTVRPGSPADKAGLKPGDRLVAIDGEPVSFFADAAERLRDLDRPVTLTVKRPVKDESRVCQPAPQSVELAVTPEQVAQPDYGLLPLRQVTEVFDDTPAKRAGFKAGDLIVRMGETAYPEADEVSEIVQASGGAPLRVTVLRDGQEQTIEVTPERKSAKASYRLGFAHGPPQGRPVLWRAGQPSRAIEAGIPEGSRLASLGGEAVDSWTAVFERIEAADGEPLEIAFVPPGAEQEQAVTVTPGSRPPETLLVGAAATKLMTVKLEPITNPVKALGYGLQKIWRTVALQGASVKMIASRQVGPDQLNGPLRIGFAFYKMVERGWGQFFQFLGLVSVAIALLNAMPVPPLDGGHVLFVVIEAVARRPVPLKVRTAVAGVGAVLLLSLVALAFFFDGMWFFQNVIG